MVDRERIILVGEAALPDVFRGASFTRKIEAAKIRLNGADYYALRDALSELRTPPTRERFLSLCVAIVAKSKIEAEVLSEALTEMVDKMPMPPEVDAPPQQQETPPVPDETPLQEPEPEENDLPQSDLDTHSPDDDPPPLQRPEQEAARPHPEHEIRYEAEKGEQSTLAGVELPTTLEPLPGKAFTFSPDMPLDRGATFELFHNYHHLRRDRPRAVKVDIGRTISQIHHDGGLLSKLHYHASPADHATLTVMLDMAGTVRPFDYILQELERNSNMIRSSRLQSRVLYFNSEQFSGDGIQVFRDEALTEGASLWEQASRMDLSVLVFMAGSDLPFYAMRSIHKICNAVFLTLLPESFRGITSQRLKTAGLRVVHLQNSRSLEKAVRTLTRDYKDIRAYASSN